MTAQQQIESWILNFLSKPNSVFNNLPPCPYAKQAWLDNKVEVIETDSKHLEQQICKILETFPDSKDLVMLVLDPSEVSYEQLKLISEQYKNEKFALLKDHPNERETVKDVILNNGKYAIIFVQRREELARARQELAGTGYYDNFDSAYKKEVLSR